MPIFTKPLTVNTKKWLDLDLDFQKHPVTNDIVKKMDVEAIKRSVRNLILTKKYERPFHPEIGNNITDLLFELVTPTTGTVLRSKIIEIIENYEPRVILNAVQVEGDIDRNGYFVAIFFTPINSVEPIQVQLFLERLR